MAIRVLVCDDYPQIRAGIRALLQHESDIEIVAEAESASLKVRSHHCRDASSSEAQAALRKLGGSGRNGGQSGSKNYGAEIASSIRKSSGSLSQEDL